jgi:hypothetical protein
MDFSAAVLSYPTVIYTTLLGVVLVYWLLALIGLVDFENTGPDLDIGGDVDIDVDVDVDVDIDTDLDVGDAGSDIHHHVDAEPGGNSPGTLVSYLVAFGLGGVPISVVISLLTLFGWVICSFAVLWLLPLVPTDILRLAVGSAVLIGAFALSIPMSAACVRPMRKLFVTHNAISNAALVGQECVILTGTVDEKFGRAEVSARGAGYHIRVIASTPNNLKRGEMAIILEYDAEKRIYLVAEKPQL